MEYPIPVVQAFVKRSGRGRNFNHILMVRDIGRKEYKLPGGGIESGESPEEALRRELYEEVGGIEWRKLNLHYAGKGTTFNERRHVSIAYTRFLVFIGHDDHPRARGEGGIEQLRWFQEDYAIKRECYFRL